jgi:hypothetical protein
MDAAPVRELHWLCIGADNLVEYTPGRRVIGVVFVPSNIARAVRD